MNSVEEMWEDGLGWKWDCFALYLHADTLKLGQTHELKINQDKGDLVYWHNAPKGKFTIKSALQIIIKESNEFEDCVWDLIWKAPAQQRIRAFLWLSCHDRLLGNVYRFKRQLTNDPNCAICNEADETTLHILRDCPASRCVWKKIGGPAISPVFFQGELKQWLIDNLAFVDGTEDNVWASYFCITIWWLWRWRNCYIFNRSSEIPLDIGAFLQVRYNETRASILNLV